MPYLQASMGGGSSSLAGLSDVNITSPESGDTIIYDANTNKWINMQGGTATVNIALTINGAKNDVIAIKNSSDVTIATCTFDPGSTQGTIRINVPVGGQSYKFISSVAKDTTTGTSDYEKTIFISDANNQTVNAYPKNALSWFGNLIKPMTATGYRYNTSPNSGSITQGNDKINIASSGQGNIAVFGTENSIDFSQFTGLKALEISNADDGFFIRASEQKDIGTNVLATIGTTVSTSTKITSLDLSNVNTNGYISLYVGSRTVTEMGCYALWFEDGHESDITIHGAKEDTITIKDLSNQTITTCNFDTGKTYGYVSKLLLPAGQSYKFISSVAKDTIVGTSNYTKTIYLEGNESEINVYPKNALYWYGNYIIGFTRESIQSNLSKTDLTNALEIHWNTNQIGSGAYYTNNQIDLSSYTKIKLNCIGISGTIRWFGEITSPNANSNNPTAIDTSNTTVGIKELDISSVTSLDYVGMLLGGSTDNAAYITISALWLENEFENSIRINGAKEDTIAIRDSNNQLVTTCIFGTGKTYGLVSKDLLSSGLYLFTSSVAKDTITGTNDYSKIITLDGTESEVNIMPEGAVYWYGNGSAVASTNKWATYAHAYAPTITTNTNSLKVQQTGGSGEISGCADFGNIDVTNFTTMKIRCSAKTGGYDWSVISLDIQDTLSQSMASSSHLIRIVSTYSSPATFSGIAASDISGATGTKHVIIVTGDNTVATPMAEITVNAIWLDDDIIIRGAKEDTITIKNSNDQTVTTCTFGSGKTYGCVPRILLPSGTYKFTSSVAKDTTTGTSDYEKMITLDGTEDTINVYPDHCYYWFGNEITDVTGGWYATRQINGGTVTKNTNNIVLNCPQASSGTNPNAYIETTNKCNFTGLTTLKLLNNNTRISNENLGMRGHWIHAGVDGAGAEFAAANSFVTGLNWLSSAITPSGDNLGYVNCHNWINIYYPSTMTVYAIYAE